MTARNCRERLSCAGPAFRVRTGLAMDQRCKLGAVADLVKPEQPHEMIAHGVVRDAKGAADLLVGLALRDQVQDPPQPGRELRWPGSRADRPIRTRIAQHDALDPGDRRLDRKPACGVHQQDIARQPVAPFGLFSTATCRFHVGRLAGGREKQRVQVDCPPARARTDTGGRANAR